MPGGEDIFEPKVGLPWVEAGVSGIPRRREWDAVGVVELPELELFELGELSFRRLEGGAIDSPPGIPVEALERIAEELEQTIQPPYLAVATRHGRLEWSAGARKLRLRPIELPAGLEAESLSVAVAPDGRLSFLVDGEEPAEISAPVRAALEKLEQQGREQFAAFVATAELVGERWELVVDPL